MDRRTPGYIVREEKKRKTKRERAGKIAWGLRIDWRKEGQRRNKIMLE